MSYIYDEDGKVVSDILTSRYDFANTNIYNYSSQESKMVNIVEYFKKIREKLGDKYTRFLIIYRTKQQRLRWEEYILAHFTNNIFSGIKATREEKRLKDTYVDRDDIHSISEDPRKNCAVYFLRFRERYAIQVPVVIFDCITEKDLGYVHKHCWNPYDERITLLYEKSSTSTIDLDVTDFYEIRFIDG